jgi:hypothetical protein
MDALSYFSSEFGDFDDEFYQYQTSVDGEYQNYAQPAQYFEGVTHPYDQSYDASRYTVVSNSFQSNEAAFTYNSSMTGAPSTAYTGSPVEDFQYIDFDQSHMTEPQASLNVPVPSVAGAGNLNEFSLRAAQPSHTASTSFTSSEKKAHKKETSKRPPPPRRGSSVNASPNSHKVSPKPDSTAAEPSSNINTRSTKKSRGPPKSSLTVFDSNLEPHTRRKSRSAFTEEGKKKVEAVRRVGACNECRFRKRTVGPLLPCQSFKLTRHSVEQVSRVKDVLKELDLSPWLQKSAFGSLLSLISLSLSVCFTVIYYVGRS